MKRNIINLILLIIITLIILNTQFLLSLGIMSVVNRLNYKDSVMEEEGLNINIPSGLTTKEKDWYPLMNCFNAIYFDNYVNRDVDLTILYNFGYFDGKSSVIFNPKSKYYSSFYGAYVIKSKVNEYYGFDNNEELNIDEIVKIFEYDYKYLVAGDIGCPKEKININYEILNESQNTMVSLYDNFYKIDTKINTVGLGHKYNKFHRNYLQYGIPPSSGNFQDFEPIDLFGRLYIKKLDNKITLVLYVLAPYLDIIDNCDKNILNKLTLENR